MRSALTFRDMKVPIAVISATVCLLHAEARAHHCSALKPEKNCTREVHPTKGTRSCHACTWDTKVKPAKCMPDKNRCNYIALDHWYLLTERGGYDIEWKGSKTDATRQIKAFQAHRSLEQTGIIDKETLKALRER